MRTSSVTDKPSYPVLKSKDLSQLGHLSDLQNLDQDKYDNTIDYPISTFKKIRVWVFFGTYTTIISLILFFFFYFLFANTIDQQRMYAVLNLVSHTMKSPAMADLYVTKKDCPLDYSLLTIGEWPGIEHGCYYKNEGKIVLGNCNQEDKGIGVQAIPPVMISTWEGYKFCARRYQSLAIEYSGKCPYGFKKCGTSLCIPEEDKCPITLVYWVEGAAPQNSTQEIILIDYENNRYMIVERSETRQPLVGFGLSYNGVPCLDNVSSPFPEKIYPLLGYKQNCHYGQNFEAAIIASRSEKSFVNEISALEEDIKKLPLIDNYAANNTVYFVGQNRFKIRPDDACSSPEHFFVMGKVTEKAHEISRIMNLFTVAVLFGVIIIMFLSCDQRRPGKGVMSIDLSMRNNNGAFILILCVLLFLLTLCCLVTISSRIHVIKSYRDNLYAYTSHNCFMNTFITTALMNFANGPPYQAQLFYQLIIFIGCLSALPILLIALEKCIEPEKKEILIQNPDASDQIVE